MGRLVIVVPILLPKLDDQRWPVKVLCSGHVVHDNQMKMHADAPAAGFEPQVPKSY